ncbi:DUF1987 domain-containing protein [Cohnella sp. CFH 77786]|uniref:DUF1987 domain-containing protein n=1 Tax=Cohnella sp. CFH 77786 TaxID=2662265 RepID=UPI001C60A990|nr:DUF1987 domain-containing protein [Cohnella sp. CFH 77786]MBW5449371.1 DUF1987 domain-containing protein [Cohnella sp. CFH 77786]
MSSLQPIHMASSRSTPEVRFDPGQDMLAIRGSCYPENALQFFHPLLRWVDEYLEQLPAEAAVRVELELPYINTSSIKGFLTLFEKLEAAHLTGKNIVVFWSYDEDNESERECAEEFKEDLTLPFHIQARNEG